jgi:ribosomal protein S18 acetylase RimI-like enzyme
MATPLTPTPIRPGEPEFEAIQAWKFPQEPFFVGQVKRLLTEDIPHRVIQGYGRIWVYRDPNGNTVGFGTMDLCKEYERATNGKVHCYIPLLAVNPQFQRLGHGRSILEHLIAEAAIFAMLVPALSDDLFLDVYTANVPAIKLYEKCGFTKLGPDLPILVDPRENNEPYIVMAKDVRISEP